MTSTASRPESQTDEFLGALALISTAVATICLSIVVVLLAIRSGLGTPPSLVVLCTAIVLSAAYASFLLPKACHARLNVARFVYSLLMVAAMLSPILFLWLPSRLGYIYVITALAGVIRGMPYLARSDWRKLATVIVVCGVLGFHLFTTQELGSAFLPELMVLGRSATDPGLHAALASMVRYNGVASTGVDGTVPFHYHVGSHYWFAAIASIADVDSAYAYVVGRTVFMLPALYLALLVAELCLRRSRPADAAFLVVTTAIVLILIDDTKLDRYTYRSESHVFGVIVFLLALPLLEDIVIRSERSEASHWLSLVSWLPLLFLAGWIKASAGALLAIAACYALARKVPRTRASAVVLVAAVLSTGLALRNSAGGLSEFLAIRPLGFLLYRNPWNPLFALLSTVLAFGLAAAVVLPGLRERWVRAPSRRRYFWPGGAVPLSWEELLLLIAAFTAVPVLLLYTFETWYFVDVVLWCTLAVGLARLSRADLRQLQRSVVSLRCGSAALGFALALSAGPAFRAFSGVDLVGVTTEMLTGLARDQGRPPSSESGMSLRRFFSQSVVEHHVLFPPEFVIPLRNSYGARVVDLIRRTADREGRPGLGVFVPPQNVRFWRYSVDCRSQPFFVPALTGVPMVLGLPPNAEGCRLPRTYGYADYGASSHSVDVNLTELCQHARSRGLRRVLMLRDVDAPHANTVVRCDETQR